jgi:hypothetical protein
MTIKKKSLISDSPAAKSAKKQAAKPNSPMTATKMATAMKTTMAAKIVNARTFV